MGYRAFVHLITLLYSSYDNCKADTLALPTECKPNSRDILPEVSDTKASTLPVRDPTAPV